MKYADHKMLEEAYENIRTKEENSENKPVEEGILDRAKGTFSGVKKAVSRGYESLTNPDTKDFKSLKKDISSGFKSGKSSTVISSHVQKLNSQIDDFINDLKKVGNVTDNSVANYEQASTFLKGIIKKLASTSGKGSVSVGDLKSTLGKAGFLHPSETE